jgi:prepilin-type N-terminal cleavage/methylation domain-containing protein
MREKFSRMAAAGSARGMTLMELLVTMLIVVMIASALFWMLASAKTMFQSSTGRGSNRQDLQVAAWRVAHDLRAGNVNLLTVTGPGAVNAFGFLSAFDVNGTFVTDTTGSPVWQKYIIYYIPAGTTKLLRKEVYGNFTQPLTPQQLLSYCTGDGRLLASSITVLSLSPDTTSRAATLTMTVQGTNQHGKIDRQSKKVTILIMN